MKIKILHLFPDLLDQYFDSGNILCIRKRLEWRGIGCDVVAVKKGDPIADLDNVDLIFIGGGADKEQMYVSKSLLAYKTELQRYIEDYGSLIAICGGYQLLGNYYKVNGETIKGLELLDICTETKKGRLIGDVILKSDFLKEPHNLIVGFENHGGRTYIGNHKPFGKVLYGNGNSENNGYDGVMYKNLIGSYLHGPLLPKNPELCDYILNKAIKHRYGDFEGLAPLDDNMEHQAGEYIINKYLKKRG